MSMEDQKPVKFSILGYSSSLTDRLCSLQQANILCDVAIATKNECVFAHRLVLKSTQSSVLQELLPNEMIRSKSSKSPRTVSLQLLKEENQDHVQAVIRSLYTGDIFLSNENVHAIKKIYSRLQLEDFVNICSDFVKELEGRIRVSETSGSYVEGGSGEIGESRPTQVKEKTMVVNEEMSEAECSTSKTSKGKRLKVKHKDKPEVKCSKQKSVKEGDLIHVIKALQKPRTKVHHLRGKKRPWSNRHTDKCDEAEVYLDVDGEAEVQELNDTGNGIPNKKEKTTNTSNMNKEQTVTKKKKVRKFCAHCSKSVQICKCPLGPKKYKRSCTICNLQFLDANKLYHHRKTLHAYSCTHCYFSSAREIRVAQHMYGLHKVLLDEEKYPLMRCKEPDCSFTCINPEVRKNHRESKHTERKIFCSKCGKLFYNGIKLRMHMKSHNPEEFKFSCEICHKKFYQKGLLNSHMNVVHNRLKMCHLCPWTGTGEREVIIHLYKKHGQPLPDGAKVLKCDQCDYVAFYPKTLINHKLVHSGEKTFQCQVCGKMFHTAGSLRSHSRIHLEKNIACEHPSCDYKCSTPNKLKEHMKSRHSNVKPFSCHLCPYSCKIRGNLDKHLRGTHKLPITTINDLWQKMKEEGKGYEEVLERRRKIQNREAIPLPVPPSTEVKDAKDDGIPVAAVEDKETPTRYQNDPIPLNAQMPYTTIQLEPADTDGNLIQLEFHLDNSQIMNSWA